jgi:hypothetical protein
VDLTTDRLLRKLNFRICKKEVSFSILDELVKIEGSQIRYVSSQPVTYLQSGMKEIVLEGRLL